MKRNRILRLAAALLAVTLLTAQAAPAVSMERHGYDLQCQRRT